MWLACLHAGFALTYKTCMPHHDDVRSIPNLIVQINFLANMQVQQAPETHEPPAGPDTASPPAPPTTMSDGDTSVDADTQRAFSLGQTSGASAVSDGDAYVDPDIERAKMLLKFWVGK